jgi:hypothetical protein
MLEPDHQTHLARHQTVCLTFGRKRRTQILGFLSNQALAEVLVCGSKPCRPANFTESFSIFVESRINKPNVMIKIPATKEGVPAIKQMIAEGRNVNVTVRQRRCLDSFTVTSYKPRPTSTFRESIWFSPFLQPHRKWA